MATASCAVPSSPGIFTEPQTNNYLKGYLDGYLNRKHNDHHQPRHRLTVCIPLSAYRIGFIDGKEEALHNF